MSKSTKRKFPHNVDDETVVHISSLVNIKLSEEEVSLLAQQLNEILEYFRGIDEVDTRNVEPTFHVMDIKNVLREDQVSPSLPNVMAIKNAPKKENGLFKAPRIL
ncbi:Asp-tRNA(Asn)/Glu-tRNA(Gln) amidotransferase subunit GatC [Candidatus Bathyarchaeota archaeon]|nr:Asp-tRNA(Asn)/Glu-tRNA(Gln) amidotransferase subunit GatC [Candidatus Bathyarchaeota archaeon]